MAVPKAIHDYMADMARKGNKMRSKEMYQEAAKKGWKQRKKKVINKKDAEVIDTIAHGE